MNTNFFVAEDEVFNPNKVLTRKEMDAFIGDRGIKSYAGVLGHFTRNYTQTTKRGLLTTNKG